MDYKKKEFLNIFNKEVSRSGSAEFMLWLEGTDFFFAPASTRYHGAEECGLLQHSINVYKHLKKLVKWYGFEGVYDEESIAIVSLFHDICKVGCYKEDKRWRKDKNDKWEQYSTWKKDEDFAYGGHGSKSVYLLQSFMHLTPDEASAINCHMGQWDSTIYSDPSEVYRRNKLAWMLHVADEADSYDIDPDLLV